MSELYVEDVVRIAHSYKGTKEGANNWNIFAKILDACNYFTPQKKQNVAWCATYTDCIVMLAVKPDTDPNTKRKLVAQKAMYQPSKNNYSAGVKEDADYFKKANAFFKTPKTGDKIFFNKLDSKGNIVKRFTHEGLVIDIKGNTIFTSEGNAGAYTDRVVENTYTMSQIGKKIEGFGRIKYTTEPSPTPTPPEPPKDQYKVKTKTGDTLKLREKPTTESAKLTEIPNGTTITSTEIVKGQSIGGNEAWAKTTYNGKTGYCSGYYLVPTPTITPEPVKTYKVVTKSGDGLKIREKPTNDSKQVGYFNYNDTLTSNEAVKGKTINGVNNTDVWLKTKDGHYYGSYQEGYVSGAYVTPEPRLEANS